MTVGRSPHRRRCGVALLLLALGWPVLARAQVPSDGLTGARIRSVRVELRPPPSDPQAARNLEGAVRKALRIYPGDRYDLTRVEFGVSRARGVAGVTAVDARPELADVGGVALVVEVSTSPIAAPPSFASRIRFIDDGEKLLKAMVTLKGAVPISGNQWFGNGPTLTQFSPYGTFTGGNGPNTAYDLSPKVGLAGTFPILRGDKPLYVYGHMGYLMAGIAGQANGTPDAKFSSGWEEAYAGIVGGGSTASGTSWQYNISYGKQPYCVGGAMLLCQFGFSGGARAGDFTWPRWSGIMLKAQFRLNNTVVDGFRLEANDFPIDAHAAGWRQPAARPGLRLAVRRDLAHRLGLARSLLPPDWRVAAPQGHASSASAGRVHPGARTGGAAVQGGVGAPDERQLRHVRHRRRD